MEYPSVVLVGPSISGRRIEQIPGSVPQNGGSVDESIAPRPSQESCSALPRGRRRTGADSGKAKRMSSPNLLLSPSQKDGAMAWPRRWSVRRCFRAGGRSQCCVMWLRTTSQAKRRGCELTSREVNAVEALCIQHHSRERSTMCPFCLASSRLVVGGTISTGGLAALAVEVLHKKNDGETIPNGNERSNEDGNRLS